MPSADPASAVWSGVIANLDQDPRDGMNTARECTIHAPPARRRTTLRSSPADGPESSSA